MLYLTGQAYVALGRYDDAVESLSAAVTRQQPTAEMYCRLGEADLLPATRRKRPPPLDRPLAPTAASAQPCLLDRVELARQPQGP